VNASTTLPRTVSIRRSHLVGLTVAVAVLAAAAAWAVTSLVFDRDASAVSTTQVAAPASTGIPPTGFMDMITNSPRVVSPTTVGSTGIPQSGFLNGIRVVGSTGIPRSGYLDGIRVVGSTGLPQSGYLDGISKTPAAK
jgi:hypothetical protein